MEPLVEVLRVVNVLPQVQVTSVLTYAGWMSFFMVSSRVTAAGSHPCGYVNRSQRPSVPSPTAWGRIDLDACSTPAGAGLFLLRRHPTAVGKDPRRVGSAAAGEHRGDPRRKLPRAERLDDVVVGAGLEALLDVGLLGAGGQHDDRQTVHVGVGTQGAGSVQAAHAGHHHVENHQVGLLGGAGLHGRGTIPHRYDVVPTVTQLEHDELADVCVVI